MNSNIFIIVIRVRISAHSHFNGVSGVLWQLPLEQRRSVEGAASCVVRLTTSPIPQRVVIVKHKYLTASVTEIVIPYKCWRERRAGHSTINTGANTNGNFTAGHT